MCAKQDMSGHHQAEAQVGTRENLQPVEAAGQLPLCRSLPCWYEVSGGRSVAVAFLTVI